MTWVSWLPSAPRSSGARVETVELPAPDARAALRHPRLAGASRIYLTVWERNERAIRLYESVGFQIVGTTTFTIGAGEVAEDLVMVRTDASMAQ